MTDSLLQTPNHCRFCVAAMLVVIWCLLLSACVRRLPPPATNEHSAMANSDYIDLRAGWRVRVVVPILRSGGYIVPMKTRQEGKSVSVSTGTDFIGYETDDYSVRPSRNGVGVRIVFERATAAIQGKTSKRAEPALQLFNFSPELQLVRIVYLIRESRSDHDMVILAAADEGVLRKSTEGAISGAAEECKTESRLLCVQIPPGIGLSLERESRANGHREWVPVR
jgi:hypothetical protein